MQRLVVFSLFILVAVSACVLAQAATTWYLAEGSTEGTFDTWILIQNPTSKSASVTFTFMKSDSTTVQQSITVAATSRYSLHVNDIASLSGKAFSTKIESTNGVGVIPERAMYWSSMAKGHCSGAVPYTSRTWYLAEGSTQGTFDTWILIQNPSSASASVTFTFMKSDGSTVQESITAPATSRYSYHVSGISGLSSQAFSTKVEATNGVEIVVERAVYWDSMAHGHCNAGTIY